MNEADHHFMRRAIQLAQRGLGRTRPNPAVGCVLVRDGAIIGEGWHHKAGLAHAEVEALRSVSGSAAGATGYVTLEPCSYTGRTGPCTAALLDAGITRVVIGCRDPNPKVDGLQLLRDRGVEVITGALEAECDALLRGFRSWILRKRPFVTLKVACSLDGRIATSTGHSQWITSEEARADGHLWRDRSDAILVGAGTVRADNPALTARLADGSGQDPIRVVVTTDLNLPDDSQVLAHPGASPTILATTSESERAQQLRDRGLEVWALGDGPHVPLGPLLDRLGAYDVTTLLVEGGRGVATSLLREGLVDRLLCYLAPKVIGDDGLGWAGALGIRTMQGCLRLENTTVRTVGPDVCIEGDCVYGDR